MLLRWKTSQQLIQNGVTYTETFSTVGEVGGGCNNCCNVRAANLRVTLPATRPPNARACGFSNTCQVRQQINILEVDEYNVTFGQELVVLYRKPSMFDKFSVHAWRWCEGLNNEHSISVQSGSNSFWPPMNWNRLLFIQIQTLPLSMHHK